MTMHYKAVCAQCGPLSTRRYSEINARQVAREHEVENADEHPSAHQTSVVPVADTERVARFGRPFDTREEMRGEW